MTTACVTQKGSFPCGVGGGEEVAKPGGTGLAPCMHPCRCQSVCVTMFVCMHVYVYVCVGTWESITGLSMINCMWMVV